MPRVVWGHERSLARAFDQRPTQAGLLVVVEAAEAIRVDIARPFRCCPVAAVVFLQSGDPIAAQDRARRVTPLHGRDLGGGEVAPEVRHADDVCALGGDGYEEGV